MHVKYNACSNRAVEHLGVKWIRRRRLLNRFNTKLKEKSFVLQQVHEASVPLNHIPDATSFAQSVPPLGLPAQLPVGHVGLRPWVESAFAFMKKPFPIC